MSTSDSPFQAFIKSPILWGAAATVGFYGLVEAGIVHGHYVDSYFTGHPVEYTATAIFFVGLAVLVIKTLSIAVQRKRLDEPFLGPPPDGGQPVADCRVLAARLDRLPPGRQSDYLVRRLRAALEYVRRNASAEGLDEELRFLADADAARLHASYGMVRIIIWAIPVLGFLGTVIGITLAVGKLTPDALEASLPEVTRNLSIAFDTTAQALWLSIILMFAQFLTDRAESRLLADVDQRADADLVGRFQRSVREADGQLGAVRLMIEEVIVGTEKLVRRQSDLWQSTVAAAAERWQNMAAAAGSQLQSALAASLDQSLQRHAATLAASAERVDQQSRQSWERIQQSLSGNTQSLIKLNEAVREEAELIGQAVDAAGKVTSLEEALNHNLRALAGSKNFEETVMSLAAAIHLLNSRLGSSPAETPRVQLESTRKTGKAA